jgi:hypothetical protein
MVSPTASGQRSSIRSSPPKRWEKGLALARNIVVEKHRGELTFDSEVGFTHPSPHHSPASSEDQLFNAPSWRPLCGHMVVI